MTIHRLSPKNQVTVPREARALSSWGTPSAGSEATTIQHLRGRRHVVRKPETSEQFRILLLMTELELQKTESRISANAKLSDDEKFAVVTRLNDAMKTMAVDAQNRVVLPAELIAHLALGEGRDLKFVCTNSMIQIWNPDHYLRYANDVEPTYDALLNTHLFDSH